MVNAITVTAIYALIGAIQIYYLLKQKLYKEILVSLLILAIALFYSYGIVLRWNLPGPTEFISVAIKPLAKLVFGELF